MGFFGAIEGGDGSGKGTQAKIYAEYAQKTLGMNVLKLSLPGYDDPESLYVRRYLNGQYGEANSVPADLASLAYSFDRIGKKDLMQQHLELPNSLLLADRFTGSNMAHQGTKFTKPEDRKAFYEEMMWAEWEFLGLPKPDLNVVLLVKTSLAQANVDRKDARSYTTMQRDIHEADENHLERAKQNYEELVRLYPDTFVGINSMNDTDAAMRSIDNIQQEVRTTFQAAIDAEAA